MKEHTKNSQNGEWCLLYVHDKDVFFYLNSLIQVKVICEIVYVL